MSIDMVGLSADFGSKKSFSRKIYIFACSLGYFFSVDFSKNLIWKSVCGIFRTFISIFQFSKESGQ